MVVPAPDTAPPSPAVASGPTTPILVLIPVSTRTLSFNITSDSFLYKARSSALNENGKRQVVASCGSERQMSLFSNGTRGRNVGGVRRGGAGRDAEAM